MYGAYLPKKPRRVLILGSGALQIGQAGEFDYSGSQAIKAFKEEGVFTVLVNPNIATIQTSGDMADRTYLVAVLPEFVERIIVKEEIDGILLAFGGQTALNCGLELAQRGVLERLGVRVLGTPIEAIRNTEDRLLFVERLDKIGVKTARSIACQTIAQAREAAHTIGLPVMLRLGFALGGKGSGIVDTRDQLEEALRRAFDGNSPQVLVEESLRGWKEIEYEVMRDARDNCIAVCNMENMDPVGVHTGESIVVAPSQTLNDDEYQLLRTIAIKTIRHLKIVGECNIQYALDPNSSEYRVIEVNARLSRSSALASKAAGYPLAYVAAKLALGYTLAEIPNGITRRTTSFFEPALDYLVCKVPRWDLSKFQGASVEIGSEMKSVGEVMAIGRSFPEVVQKALRMLDIGVDGLDCDAFEFKGTCEELKTPTPFRVFGIAKALAAAVSVDDIHAATKIDRWFISAINSVVSMHESLRRSRMPIDETMLRQAKLLGFSDAAIERLTGSADGSVRRIRAANGVHSNLPQIDTMAAEFPSETNYLYSTYGASVPDVVVTNRRKVIVIGSGVYRIGSSVEFDWCAVNAVKTAAALGYETIMLNCNPETVSTDYDVCDKLVFDEISFESVLDLYERENCDGVIVSMGGQIPNNLALPLYRAGVKILGTHPERIDAAEDRSKFGALLDNLGIDQPRWFEVTDVSAAYRAVEDLGGYPVLVRPSYVLSGAAMSVANEPNALQRILERAQDVSREHPVVVTKFEAHAREVEVDGVADKGELLLWAISEHIEDAGVHSGDATLVLPPQTLYIATIRKVKQIAAAIARALEISGPFNVQFLAKHNVVKVIECNLRASRSFPFVSKVTGHNFAAEATRCLLGQGRRIVNNSLDLEYVGVKVPMFSFSRLHGADPMLGVEMASTGEVGCIGEDVHDALLHGLLATGFRFPRTGVLLSLGPWEDKFWFADEARVIANELSLPIYATDGTAAMLREVGVPCTVVGKGEADLDPQSASGLIGAGKVDLVINVPREYDEYGRPDGYVIRRRAIDAGVPLITDRQLARAVIEALRWRKLDSLSLVSWNDRVARDPQDVLSA
jgi:carbamoyl-phosphate synthase large subunit